MAVATLPKGRIGRRHRNRLARQENRYFYLFMAPWIIGFIVFQLGPLIASFVLSFFNWEVLTPPTWAGADNWTAVIHDGLFWQSLKVTTIYALFSVPLGLVSSFLLAVLLNSKVRGITIFRTIFYLPSVCSGVAVALLWTWIFSPTFGLLNYLLSLVGVPGPKWLFDTHWVLPSFILMSLWGIGGSMVIYLAGLQSVPTELYEAAAIDGAGKARQFWHITIPMVSPVIFYNLIIGIIGTFQTFTQAYVMTNGGPDNASLFYGLYLYFNAFQYFKMGYAATLAWILFVIVAALSFILFRTSGWVHYEGGTAR